MRLERGKGGEGGRCTGSGIWGSNEVWATLHWSTYERLTREEGGSGGVGRVRREWRGGEGEEGVEGWGG